MKDLLKLSDNHPKLFIDMLESLKDSFYISDHEGTTLWMNSVSEAMCCLPRNEIIGRNVRDLEKEGVFNPSVSRLALEAGKNVSTVQEMNNGRKYITSGHLIKDESGKIIAVVAHCRDITEVVKNTSKLKEIEELLEKYSLEIRKLTEASAKKQGKSTFIIGGNSPNRVDAASIIEKIAAVDTTALITGETGTGKSLAAERIHQLSKRNQGPFVHVNCASLPEALLESELFGYEEGAFTGAISKGKDGLIKTAESGTLFLDEIGELPLQLQTKILHFLQSKTYMPIGGRRAKKADVRIIAATNRNLEQMVGEGHFRTDLFYRLNVLSVQMPPLRDSVEDLGKIALHFLDIYNVQYHKNKTFSDTVLKIFQSYSWPGNIRELENLIERLVILSEGEEITEEDLPQKMIERRTAEGLAVPEEATLFEALEAVEKQMIIDALEREQSTRKAAKCLGVSQSLIMRRVKKYNIKLQVEESRTFIVT